MILRGLRYFCGLCSIPNFVDLYHLKGVHMNAGDAKYCVSTNLTTIKTRLQLQPFNFLTFQFYNLPATLVLIKY